MSRDVKSRNYTISISTQQKITFDFPTGKIEPQYPSSWFERNTGTKPELHLELNSTTIMQAASKVNKGINDLSLNLEDCKTFLYYFLKDIECTLEEDWNSYNVQIGKKGDKVSPLILLNIETKAKTVDSTGSPIEEKKYPWLALYILGVYRVIRAQVREYRATIVRRISEQMEELCPGSSPMSEAVSMNPGWANDEGYNKMVAATDMFFNRFPEHKYSNMRVATLESRNRDCAALLSFGYLMEVMGVQEKFDVMKWVFVPQIADDLKRIMKEGEENTDAFSYFPYQVDLGLVLKSSYSAKANPYFFEWVHLIGAMLKRPRSLNARHLNEYQSMNILLNAGCVAFIFSHAGASAIQQTVASARDIHSEILKSRDPEEWVRYLKGINNQMPSEVKKFIKNVAATSGNPRHGTVGKYLKDVAATL